MRPRAVLTLDRPLRREPQRLRALDRNRRIGGGMPGSMRSVLREDADQDGGESEVIFAGGESSARSR
jgi:hypothetical protein